MLDVPATDHLSDHHASRYVVSYARCVSASDSHIAPQVGSTTFSRRRAKKARCDIIGIRRSAILLFYRDSEKGHSGAYEALATRVGHLTNIVHYLMCLTSAPVECS